MNIVEALDLVEQGEKVRLPGWIAGSYVGKVPPTQITSNVGPRANVDPVDTYYTEKYFQSGVGQGKIFVAYLSETEALDWEVLP